MKTNMNIHNLLAHSSLTSKVVSNTDTKLKSLASKFRGLN